MTQTKQFHCLDGVQGAGKQRSEMYKQYFERVAQIATQQSAKSISGANSSAGWQANVAGEL